MSIYKLSDIFIGDYPVTQVFGNNFKLDNGSWAYAKGHMGIDFGTPKGTQLVACFSGEVLRASDYGDGYGNQVTIWNHEQQCAAQYGHLSAISVAVGQNVWSGQLIGLSGGVKGEPGSGFSTGAHLHFGIIPTDANGYRTNPSGSIAGCIDPAGMFTEVRNLSEPVPAKQPEVKVTPVETKPVIPAPVIKPIVIPEKQPELEHAIETPRPTPPNIGVKPDPILKGSCLQDLIKAIINFIKGAKW